MNIEEEVYHLEVIVERLFSLRRRERPPVG
jgi:hypothetical protein